MGSQSLAFFCKSTGPSQNDEASADTLVSALELYNTGLTNSYLVALKAFSWLKVQLQLLFLLRSSGKVIVANQDVNFPSWFTMPKNVLFLKLFRCFHLCDCCNFAGICCSTIVINNAKA